MAPLRMISPAGSVRSIFWLLCIVHATGTALPSASPTVSPTSRSPTVVPTTRAPTHMPTNATNTTNTTSAPTISVAPTVAFYKDYGFVRSYGDQVAACGYSAMAAYLTFMYASVFAGPVLLAAFYYYRWQAKDGVIKLTKVTSWQKLGLLIGMPVWLFNYFLMSVSPRDCDTLYVELTLEVLAFIIVLVTAVWAMNPNDKQINALFTQMGSQALKEGMCNVVDCKAVQQFSMDQLGDEPKVDIVRDDNGFRATLWLRGVNRVFGGSIRAYTAMGSGESEMQAMDDAYKKAADYWDADPEFSALRAQLGRDAKKWVMASPSNHPSERHGSTVRSRSESPQGRTSIEMSSPTRIHAGGKEKASHLVCLAIQQKIVVRGSDFDKTCSYSEGPESMCSFRLEKGVSPLARALSLKLVVLNGTYPKGVDADMTRVYQCSRLGEAVPFLINGYTTVDHYTGV